MTNSIRQMLLVFLFASIATLSMSQTRYVNTVFDSITIETFDFSKIHDTILKLDVYQPEKDTLTKRPLMLIVHGGGFNTGQRNSPSIVSIAKRIAQKGYVVASVDYRLLAANQNLGCNTSKDFKLKTFSKVAEDVIEALQYLGKYKEDFKIDDSKIILFGSSAGAETILNLTYNRDLVLNQNYITNIPTIAAVISVSGAILDSSLITQSNTVPGVFYHGTADLVVPYDIGSHHACTSDNEGYLIEYGSKAIVKKLESLNGSFLLHSYLNRKHDIFDLPAEDIHQAFVFIKKVVIDKEFYQATILD